ncbi:DNA polymerase eta isoform X16 [Solanum lycopersicum]|uniref:DNA polymerase eta isoform X16 n=1 Tax=Solanum lycopersicum TaxID=4081 RepID=UPI0037489E55
MPVARPELSDCRVIAHVDMDCFYVQVEQRKQPSLRGQPTAVVQYNSWQGGGLIAVSYEARKFGVKRSMRGDEAKQVCPEIHLVQVPVARGKADLNAYRNAGSEVGSDARENVRHWFTRSDASRRDKLLACGAFIVAELRLQVLEETEFTCSAGIAHNKMLAKLASGMNKPAQQTVVPFSSVSKLLRTLPIKKMKQLGGKLGTSLQIDLGVNTVGDMLQFSEEKLQGYYGVNTGSWLWNTARGINGEEVKGRLLPNSHGSGKTFPGPRALKTVASVGKWLNELCDELSERLQSDLEQNKRIAHTLTLHAHAYKSNDGDSFRKFPSKSCPLRYGTSKIKEDALSLFQAGLREYLGLFNVKISGNQNNGWGITGLSVTASKIVAIPSGTRSILNYFHNQEEAFPQVKLSSEQLIQDAPLLSPSEDSLESGGHLTLQTIEPWIACREENEETKYSMSLDRQEEDKNTCKEKKIQVMEVGILTCRYHARLCYIQLPDKETSICSSPDAEVYRGWEKDQNESSRDYLTVKIRDSLESEDGKRKSNKEKGMSTISRYFQSQLSGSLLKAEHANTSRLSESSSLSDRQSELPQENSPARGESSVDTHLCSQIKLKRPSWSYDIDKIDQDVLNELPKQIQEEVQAWLRPQKRPNTVKKDLGITRYFLPAKDK